MHETGGSAYRTRSLVGLARCPHFLVVRVAEVAGGRVMVCLRGAHHTVHTFLSPLVRTRHKCARTSIRSHSSSTKYAEPLRVPLMLNRRLT